MGWANHRNLPQQEGQEEAGYQRRWGSSTGWEQPLEDSSRPVSCTRSQWGQEPTPLCPLLPLEASVDSNASSGSFTPSPQAQRSQPVARSPGTAQLQDIDQSLAVRAGLVLGCVHSSEARFRLAPLHACLRDFLHCFSACGSAGGNPFTIRKSEIVWVSSLWH